MAVANISLPGRPGRVPTTLYVHLPWCRSKCPYCDFNSHEVAGGLPERRYLDALRADLESWLPAAYRRPIHAVFIGGGTPSLFSAEGIARLLSDIRMLLALEADAEITLEANPDSHDATRFAEYAACGINRLSLGVQSFADAALDRLGRAHDAAQAHAATATALASFERVNLDLMHALPGQDVAAAREDVRLACAYGPEHLSCYHLMLEPGAAFFRRPPPGLPAAELAADIDDAIQAELAAAGYGRYEISAYARTGAARCRHNLNYWRFGDYLAVGAGAHAKFTATDGVWRERRARRPLDYIERCAQGRFATERARVGAAELGREFLLNALRLVDGFDHELFYARTGLPLAAIEAQLARACELGLLERDAQRIRPTARGLDLQLDLQQLFVPATVAA